MPVPAQLEGKASRSKQEPHPEMAQEEPLHHDRRDRSQTKRHSSVTAMPGEMKSNKQSEKGQRDAGPKHVSKQCTGGKSYYLQH